MHLSAATKNRMVAIAIVLTIICIDQTLKFWVKTNMCLGQSIQFTDWAYLLFTENKGMAFGMDFIGTLLLCCFRIVAIGFLAWSLWAVTRKPKIKIGFVILLSMVMAGAAGNIFDNVFYGLIFTDSLSYMPAHLTDFGEGYGSFLEGHVVDMFYFPIIHITWPQWLPLIGGNDFVFFSPIFNFADASITTGGFLMVCCYYKTLNSLLAHKSGDSQSTPSASNMPSTPSNASQSAPSSSHSALGTSQSAPHTSQHAPASSIASPASPLAAPACCSASQTHSSVSLTSSFAPSEASSISGDSSPISPSTSTTLATINEKSANFNEQSTNIDDNSVSGDKTLRNKDNSASNVRSSQREDGRM